MDGVICNRTQRIRDRSGQFVALMQQSGSDGAGCALLLRRSHHRRLGDSGRFAGADAARPPFADAGVDFIPCNHTLPSIREDRRGPAEIARCPRHDETAMIDTHRGTGTGYPVPPGPGERTPHMTDTAPAGPPPAPAPTRAAPGIDRIDLRDLPFESPRAPGGVRLQVAAAVPVPGRARHARPPARGRPLQDRPHPDPGDGLRRERPVRGRMAAGGHLPPGGDGRGEAPGGAGGGVSRRAVPPTRRSRNQTPVANLGTARPLGTRRSQDAPLPGIRHQGAGRRTILRRFVEFPPFMLAPVSFDVLYAEAKKRRREAARSSAAQAT